MKTEKGKTELKGHITSRSFRLLIESARLEQSFEVAGRMTKRARLAGLAAESAAEQLQDLAEGITAAPKRGAPEDGDVTNTPFKKRVHTDLEFDDASDESDASETLDAPFCARWIQRAAVELDALSHENVFVGTVNVHQTMARIQKRIYTDRAFTQAADDRKDPFEYL
ncbi:hypothetical protein HDU87_000051 [Geranomyces variabilis]|uniref:Uncharacterized protein n=1 Tax=Geranomyces variabilis TaxID=109894 RepID=A0AAD5TTU9_9FUNG|nr:hypothetical protein HDU87_000051 [Geranomyces variabilis]